MVFAPALSVLYTLAGQVFSVKLQNDTARENQAKLHTVFPDFIAVLLPTLV